MKEVRMSSQNRPTWWDQCWEAEEDVRLLSPTLSRWFVRCGGHTSINKACFNANRPSLRGTFSAYNYPHFVGDSVVTIPLRPSTGIADVFFDTTSETVAIAGAVSLQLEDGTFVGCLIPGDNILFATDWTHSVGEEEAFLAEGILWWLEDNGYLRPLHHCPWYQGEEPEDYTPPEEPIQVSLGGDPEFELFTQARLVRGDQHFPSIHNGLGMDGSGQQVEVRPMWSYCPELVVESMQQLLAELAANGYEVAHAGHIYPLGGHIHIGGAWPAPELVEVLDDFIGRPTQRLSGAARGCYGQLGDVREQPHGFEYRTPPAAVWACPRMATITLAIAKGLTERLFNEGVLRYAEPPRAEDYVACAGISLEEAYYFLEYCDSRGKCIEMMAAWQLPTKTWQQAIVLSPNDRWPHFIRDALHEAFKDVRFHRTILLFGFAGRRGLVFSWPCSLGEHLPFEHPRNPYYAYGLPREVRFNEHLLAQALEELRLHLLAQGIISM